MGNSRTVREAVESLRLSVEAANRARQDPTLQAKAAEEYAGRVVDMPELRRRAREQDWQARGIPRRLWASFHDGAPPSIGEPTVTIGPLAPRLWPALKAVTHFLSPGEDGRLILALVGPPGCGKTTAAAWGAAWMPGSLFVKCRDIVRAGLYPTDSGFWPRLFAARLVVVDDFGVEPYDSKGYAASAVEDLLDHRYDSAGKTIITSNMAEAPFRKRLGLRSERRLDEVGVVMQLEERKP